MAGEEGPILTTFNPQEAFDQAVSHQRGGRLKEAERLYRQVLAHNPDHAGALHFLGMIVFQTGRKGDAIDFIRRAVALKPSWAEAYGNLGAILKSQGQFDEAIAAFSKAIELKPGYGPALMNLGRLFLEQGRFRESCQYFQQLAHASPHHPDVHLYLATALAELRRLDEATEALDRAAALAPDAAMTHSVRGIILSRSTRGTEAIDSFRRAAELAPKSASSWINLGIALRKIGRFAEAIECCRRVLAFDPGEVEAYTLMASVGATPDAAELVRLEKYFKDGQASARVRAALGFVLGKVMDEADRFDEAFGFYATANSLVLNMRQAAGERYDGDAFAKRIDESIATYTPSFFERARSWGDPSELPVFVVGMPRSGTSLVEQIASTHPDVFGAGELTDMVNIANEVASKGFQPDSIRDAARKQLGNLRFFGGSAQRVIDKLPSNVERLGLIATLFPSARVLLCRRDPRDTCLSCFFQHFNSGITYSYDLAQCGRHHVETDRLIAHWTRVLPVRMLPVQYEDLVADLEGQSRRIIEFLGLPWNPACLEFHRTERTVQTSSDWQVRQPIYTRSVGRWRNYEKHLGPLLQAFNQQQRM